MLWRESRKVLWTLVLVNELLKTCYCCLSVSPCKSGGSRGPRHPCPSSRWHPPCQARGCWGRSSPARPGPARAAASTGRVGRAWATPCWGQGRFCGHGLGCPRLTSGIRGYVWFVLPLISTRRSTIRNSCYYCESCTWIHTRWHWTFSLSTQDTSRRN